LKTKAVIGLGANLGDREANIAGALGLIGSHLKIELEAVSSLYESDAVTEQGVDPDLPKYLNAVAIIQTTLKPNALLRFLNQIEKHYGRVRTHRWAARTLDLDIISFGNLEIQTRKLVLPHPAAHTRGFVLLPWLEIDPLAELPGQGKIADLAKPVSGEVWRYVQN
jgi:2-amino-4-hydroxy-6-hydroxymethyldihydropteridine diphosphokinase